MKIKSIFLLLCVWCAGISRKLHVIETAASSLSRSSNEQNSLKKDDTDRNSDRKHSNREKQCSIDSKLPLEITTEERNVHVLINGVIFFLKINGIAG